jgi:nitrogen-specific signal transduction histidine kinase
MNTNNNKKNEVKNCEELIEILWDSSWTYIKTVVDVIREPVLILDKDFSVMTANEAFYRNFQVEPKDTEGKSIYKLGNGQWNIPALRKLLEEILPNNKFFKGFEVTHDFPFIGKKVMVLNAKQIHFKEDPTKEKFPPIILLAIEDITQIMLVAETLSNHAKYTEATFTKKTDKLEDHILELKKEINKLKKDK